MTTTLSTTSSPTVPGSSTARRTALWKVGAAAALVGAVATEAVAGIARAVGVPMQAGGFGASHAEAIGVGSFAMATVINLIVGTMLAAALVRWARHQERTFVRTALTLTAVSFVPVLLAAHTAGSTKVTLALTHLVVAAIAIPKLRRAVAVRTAA
jgi:hypothetical protein